MNKDGFVAALDQSGGSIKKALLSYGVTNLEGDLFEVMHDMRMRVLKNIDYSKINGVIIFEGEVNRKIDGKNIIDYLIDKDALAFVKIDKGLEEEENGVSLMKDIPNLENTLDLLKEKGVYGTKMRSVIYENNILGIINYIYMLNKEGDAKSGMEKQYARFVGGEIGINGYKSFFDCYYYKCCC